MHVFLVLLPRGEGTDQSDLDILWKTIHVNLPDLKIQINQLVNRKLIDHKFEEA